MSVNFLNFTENNSVALANTDYLVGFANSSRNGERRWPFSLIKSSITSGIQTPKAWGTFTKTGQLIGNSFNISTIADTSTKLKTVTFSSPLPNSKPTVVYGWGCATGATTNITTAIMTQDTFTTTSIVINHFDESQPWTAISFLVFA